jgi:hypothetical protein
MVWWIMPPVSSSVSSPRIRRPWTSLRFIISWPAEGEKQNRVDEALQHLRSALRIESQRPSYQTRAWLTFGRLAVEHQLQDLYPEFMAIAEGKANARGGLAANVVFPLDRYVFSGILALIARDSGDAPRAREHARLALAAADLKHSGFRYHPKVGLVQESDTPMYRELVQIAGDG